MNPEVLSEVMLDVKVVEKFRLQLHGELIQPGEKNYDIARKVWNAMIDKHPSLIVRCADAADVIHCVNFARVNKIIVAIRGGGHNIAGNAVCDGGLVIDLSQMKAVKVDPGSLTARVEAGATLADYDLETQAFGLATPLGINSTTGVAGLTLGGGFGWLSRKYGLTIDNLLSADVVTADGNLITVNETDNSDLFWAIRGGGGNFGVVTAFEFKLHKIGPEILSGLLLYPLDAAFDVLRFYREFINKIPEEFVCWFVLRKAPPAPFISPEWHGKEVLALAVSYYGDIEEGKRIAEPLRKFSKPVADNITQNQYKEWQKALDASATPGMRNYWKSHYFSELSDSFISTCIDFAGKLPDVQSDIKFAPLGGAISRIPAEATSYTNRDAKYIINITARWENPAKDNECIEWTRQLFDAAAPYSFGGVYVNFMNHEEQGRVPAAYGVNYTKLMMLKNKYDPENLFRINQNIKPGKDI